MQFFFSKLTVLLVSFLFHPWILLDLQVVQVSRVLCPKEDVGHSQFFFFLIFKAYFFYLKIFQFAWCSIRSWSWNPLTFLTCNIILSFCIKKILHRENITQLLHTACNHHLSYQDNHNKHQAHCHDWTLFLLIYTINRKRPCHL